MRENSDPRTTLGKVVGLRTEVKALLRELSTTLPATARSSSILNLIDMIEEEVGVMAKCQYEMRKTIQNSKYASKI